MKILYDYQAFTIQYFGGVSKCFCELIRNLPQDIDYDIAIKQSNNVHLIDSGIKENLESVSMDSKIFKKNFNFFGSGHIYKILKDMPFYNTAERINEAASITALEKEKFDVFHPTFFDTYFLKHIGNKPFVLTIHDMIPELYFKSNDMQIVNKRILVKYAAHIIAVSQKTKDDIVNILGVSPNKISVIYHGAPDIVLSQTYKKITADKKYFLYVGQRNSYKKFTDFLIQSATLFKKNKDIYLECTGNPFTNKEKEIIKQLGLENYVKVEFVSEEKLSDLYKNALAFIYPSEYEGFGIPILEAFSYGCPVLLNNKSCFPEIAGEAALYFDLDDGRSLVQQMNYILNMDDEAKKQLINLGYKRLSLFSWKKSAMQLADIYKSLM